MKLYTAKSPMSLRVNVFVAEKDIAVPTQWLNVLEGETRTDEYLQKNSLAQVPLLALDDGSYLPESLAICRYLESLYPENPLLGREPVEMAKIDMWSRRMEFHLCKPITDFALHSFSFFADKVQQIPAYADSQLQLQSKRWQWLDKELADGRTYLVDDAFSMADIAGMTALMVSDFAEQPIADELTHVKRWESAVRAKKGW